MSRGSIARRGSLQGIGLREWARMAGLYCGRCAIGNRVRGLVAFLYLGVDQGWHGPTPHAHTKVCSNITRCALDAHKPGGTAPGRVGNFYSCSPRLAVENLL